MADGYVLGIDFGLKHIGVAVGQTVTQTANGLVTIRAKNGNPDWSEFEQLLTQYRPLAVIVGLPLNMDGTSSEMSDRATAFAQALAKR
ncbi:MAG: Holliday junction resolvase RuvX, partial [Proteobacteria bacterium]|nr:Holliday junction resolvase RuvX [Pseudomonadota bacterium]